VALVSVYVPWEANDSSVTSAEPKNVPPETALQNPTCVTVVPPGTSKTGWFVADIDPEPAAPKVILLRA
jgi:hypothetical protein